MGVPTSSPWLRRFNSTKPKKFFIEIIAAVDLESGVPFNLFVNEGFTRKMNGQVNILRNGN